MLFPIPRSSNTAGKEQQRCAVSAMLLLCAVACAGLSSEANSATPKKKVVLKAKPIAKAPPAAPSPGAAGSTPASTAATAGAAPRSENSSFFEQHHQRPNGMAGVTFGYNAQSGSVVYGVETDIDAAWMTTKLGRAALFRLRDPTALFRDPARPAGIRRRQSAAVHHRAAWPTEALSTASLVSGSPRQSQVDGYRPATGSDTRCAAVGESRIPLLRVDVPAARIAVWADVAAGSGTITVERQRRSASPPHCCALSRLRNPSPSIRSATAPRVAFSIGVSPLRVINKLLPETPRPGHQKQRKFRTMSGYGFYD